MAGFVMTPSTQGSTSPPPSAAEQIDNIIPPKPVTLSKRRSRLFLRPLTSNRQNVVKTAAVNGAGCGSRAEVTGAAGGMFFFSPTGSSQKQKLQQTPCIFRALSGEGFSINGRKWTPPLSPSVGRVATPTAFNGENVPTAAEYVMMLKRPGVPPLPSVTDLKNLVHAASRAWLRDFRIRGGRSRVNDKLTEMEQIESTLTKSNFFRRRQQKKQRLQITIADIVAAREELTQVLLFLHLRE